MQSILEKYMKLIKVYNKKVFEGFLYQLNIEYKEDQNVHYDDSRLNETLNKLMSKEYKMLCLRLDKGFYAGYCVVNKLSDNAVDIANFYIRTSYRGKGYGKLLLSMVEDYLLNKGVNKISLAARPGKEGFYLSCGYSGKGILQAEFETATKQEIEKFLHQHNIQILDYKVWNKNIHQFFFDAKEILYNPNFLPECRKKNYYSQVLFEKELVAERSINDAQSGGNN